MDSEHAETYLRDLAESELRRWRGGAPQVMLEATARVRMVAAALAQTGALDAGVADAVLDDLVTALEIRSPGDPRRRWMVARNRRVNRVAPGAVPPVARYPVSVAPAGELLELRDGETDTDVYLVAVLSTPNLFCLSAGVLSLGKGSLPCRRAKRRGVPAQAPRVLPGFHLPGIPGDLRAVDDSGQSYDLIFSGGGDNTWSAGEFSLQPNPPARRLSALAGAAWLDVGNDENSVRIDLTARSAAIATSTTAIELPPGEAFLRIRAEAMFASGFHDIGTDLPALAAVVPALRAAGRLPAGSVFPRQIAALCRRYAVASQDVPDPPAPLPDRWDGLLTESYDSWLEADGAGPPPAAAHLQVTFPETDGVSTVLSGLVTRGRRSTVLGAFFGAIEQGYPDGPCIWLRDDGGQWHVAKPGSWGSGGVNVFGANVVPPVAPSVTAVDVLLISRTAEVRATVPLTWWTS